MRQAAANGVWYVAGKMANGRLPPLSLSLPMYATGLGYTYTSQAASIVVVAFVISINGLRAASCSKEGSRGGGRRQAGGTAQGNRKRSASQSIDFTWHFSPT